LDVAALLEIRKASRALRAVANLWIFRSKTFSIGTQDLKYIKVFILESSHKFNASLGFPLPLPLILFVTVSLPR
jgi:hypothetical protein